jgi:two-component system response regulator MprA
VAVVSQYSSADPPCVLVVSADAALRRRCRSALEGAGLAVELAADGLDALEALAARRPAAILLDAVLPDLDLAVLAAAVRAAYGEAVPIFLLGPPEAAELGRRIRARAHVREPIRSRELLAAVRSVLRVTRGWSRVLVSLAGCPPARRTPRGHPLVIPHPLHRGFRPPLLASAD